MSKKAFIVSIDEIQQNFVFCEPFVGAYTNKVTMSDGTTVPSIPRAASGGGA